MARITQINANDYNAWHTLWQANCEYKVSDEVTQTTWSRLCDPDNPVHGLVAWNDRFEMTGLMHYILHPVTGYIKPVAYMQDLYIVPDQRRTGIAQDLVEHLASMGKEQGWPRIYWLVENSNIPAQALYKKMAVKLDFSLYLMPLNM